MSASAAGGAPPPPPPPPPPPGALPPASATGGGVAAVFAELNRGEDVTKNLRKVDKSEMTHKNPALRASSTVPTTAVSTACAPNLFRLLRADSHDLGAIFSIKEADQASKTAGAYGQEACQIRTGRQQVGHCACFTSIFTDRLPIEKN